MLRAIVIFLILASSALAQENTTTVLPRPFQTTPSTTARQPMSYSTFGFTDKATGWTYQSTYPSAPSSGQPSSYTTFGFTDKHTGQTYQSTWPNP